MTGFDINVFKRQLAETITWCSARFTMENVKDSLRTITPTSSDNLLRLSESELVASVQGVISQRADQLQQNKQRLVTDLTIGRLLIFIPEYSFFDGVGELESNGFIDYVYFPPWDTWVDFIIENESFRMKHDNQKNYLISWVPPQMIELVDVARQFDPGESLLWATDCTSEFAYLRLLKQHDLLF